MRVGDFGRGVHWKMFLLYHWSSPSICCQTITLDLFAIVLFTYIQYIYIYHLCFVIQYIISLLSIYIMIIIFLSASVCYFLITLFYFIFPIYRCLLCNPQICIHSEILNLCVSLLCVFSYPVTLAFIFIWFLFCKTL